MNEMNKYGYSRVYDIDFLLDYEKKDHYLNLISNMVDMTNCKSYLELGIDNMGTINMVKNKVDMCVGVDMKNTENKENIIFHQMTTDEFFKVNDKTFDIIFIDADHRFKQVEIDFENSLTILNEFGIIILHDTDPIDSRLLGDIYCSDSYKIIDHVYVNHPELNIITFPIHETGLSFVMRRKDRRKNKFKI